MDLEDGASCLQPIACDHMHTCLGMVMLVCWAFIPLELNPMHMQAMQTAINTMCILNVLSFA